MPTGPIGGGEGARHRHRRASLQSWGTPRVPPQTEASNPTMIPATAGGRVGSNMFKMRVALFGALVLLVTSGLAASTASAAGPFWHVNGSKLPQGKVSQIKLQLKGGAVLTTPSVSAEVECKGSVSEGATISNSPVQGQGKGRVTYTSCKVLKPEKECKVAEPITTNQLKTYLATSKEAKQKKYVAVFEPTVGDLFVKLDFIGSGCGILIEGEREVTGEVAGELIPPEQEGQEGMVVYPKTAIKEVEHEGKKVPIELVAILFESTFSGVYGARLATNEPYGVFGS